jgi:PAS domain-containing protein
MNRKKFGELVRILRKERRDECGNSWTREVLYKKTKISTRTIESIENGTLVKISSEYDILSELADAFELTVMERKEFFFAAIDLDKVKSHDKLVDSFRTALKKMQLIRLPVFVVDVYGDIVAANRSVIELLGVPRSLIVDSSDLKEGYNMMRVLFLKDSKSNYSYKDLVGDQWHDSARHNMQFFRGISLRYRVDPYFQSIFSALMVKSNYPLFAKYWYNACYDNDDTSGDNVYYSYYHPRYGKKLYYLATISTILIDTGDLYGNLYSVVYIPLDEDTTKVFAEIANDVGYDLERLAPWPEKS